MTDLEIAEREFVWVDVTDPDIREKFQRKQDRLRTDVATVCKFLSGVAIVTEHDALITDVPISLVDGVFVYVLKELRWLMSNVAESFTTLDRLLFPEQGGIRGSFGLLDRQQTIYHLPDDSVDYHIHEDWIYRVKEKRVQRYERTIIRENFLRELPEGIGLNHPYSYSI